jgi:protein-disulfide isomerase
MDPRQGTALARNALTLVIGLAACASNTQALEGKVDDLAKHQRDQAALEQRVDDLAKQLAEIQTAAQATDHRLDEMLKAQQRTIDAIAANTANNPQRPARREPDRAKTYAITIDGDPVIGAADAKVTLVVASDYACPYCEKVRDTLAELHKVYGHDLRIAYKQFVVHPQVATASALAACAGARQGKFAEIDEILWAKGFKGRSFDKDDPAGGKCWESADGCPIVIGFAQELSLDTKRFKADMKSCASFVAAEGKVLQEFDVGAIPAFFINGRFLSGAMPLESFSTVIDEELKLARERIGKGTPAAKYYQKWIVDGGTKPTKP